VKRLATSLRADRPVADESTTVSAWDGTSWGFTALDGLPDLEESAGYAPPHQPVPEPLRLSTGQVPAGFDQELRDTLARLWAGPEEADAVGLPRALTVYEAEVLDALVDRRDAAIRLQQVLTDDVAQFEDTGAAVRAGRAVEFLERSVGGSVRRTVTDAVAEFECSRHRFRLALVAVGVDNGMSGAEIGTALAFSRQLASRYLHEARAKWPELEQPATRRGRRR
jgi:hypothetical protein